MQRSPALVVSSVDVAPVLHQELHHLSVFINAGLPEDKCPHDGLPCTSVYCLPFILTLTNGCQSEYSFSTVEEVSDPLHYDSLLKAKLQTLPKSVKLNQSSGAKTMTTVSTCCNDFLLSGLLKALKYFPKQSFCGTSETAILFSSFSSS